LKLADFLENGGGHVLAAAEENLVWHLFSPGASHKS